jgi:DNA-binding MurR/RpiR family transcriptional regulator
MPSIGSSATAAAQSSGAIARIRSHLLALSGAERQVAEWVLADPQQLLTLSMSQIAQQCEVSDTTVLRMCRAVGFRGFTDLKLALAQDLVRPTQLIHDDIDTGDDPAALLRKVFLANVQALYDTLDLIDPAAVIAAVDALERANTITIGGVGGSAIVAQALYQRLYRLGRRCDAPQDVQLQLMHAALSGPDDVVVAVSYSGITKDIAQLVERAKGDGATTICITGNAHSPVARRCDIVLASVSHETRSEPIAARVAQLTIVDAIAVIYSLRHLEEALASEARVVEAIVPKSM